MFSVYQVSVGKSLLDKLKTADGTSVFKKIPPSVIYLTCFDCKQCAHSRINAIFRLVPVLEENQTVNMYIILIQSLIVLSFLTL